MNTPRKDINVAIAAPSLPYRGISKKFKMMFMDAPTKIPIAIGVERLTMPEPIPTMYVEPIIMKEKTRKGMQEADWKYSRVVKTRSTKGAKSDTMVPIKQPITAYKLRTSE